MARRKQRPPLIQICLFLSADLHEALSRAVARDIRATKSDILRRGLMRELDRLEADNGGAFVAIPEGWAIPAGRGAGRRKGPRSKRQLVTRLPEDLIERARRAVFAQPELRISTLAEAGAWEEIHEGLERPRRRARQVKQKGLLGRMLDGIRGG